MNTEEISKAVAAIRAKIEAKIRRGRGKTEEVLPPMSSLSPTIWSLTDDIELKIWLEKERKAWEEWKKMIATHASILSRHEMIGPNETINIYPNPKMMESINDAHSPQEAYDMIKKNVGKDAADRFANVYIRMRLGRS